jgi:hypothetical protein
MVPIYTIFIYYLRFLVRVKIKVKLGPEYHWVFITIMV